MYIDDTPTEQVLTVRGDLDAAAVPWLREQLAQHLGEAEAGRWLVLDLAEVDFVGSAALDVLVAARAAGALLRLQSPPRALRRLITALDLQAVFPEVTSPIEQVDVPVPTPDTRRVHSPTTPA